MSTTLYIATEHGLVTFEQQDGSWTERGGALTGEHLTGITARQGALLVGTRDGVQRSVDGGQSWWPMNEGLTERHVRWLTYHPDGSGRALVGTEPASIFVARDVDEGWHACPEVANLRDANGWYLPYSPEAGCVRGFAFQDDRGYAAVEQGGVLRSDNRGETWALVEGSDGKPVHSPPEGNIQNDVHSIAIHPSSPNRVAAPTGGGFYTSVDGGRSWTELYDCYVRAVWLDPGYPGHMVLGPASGVDRNGRIEETINGGDTWHPIMNGLDDPWPHHMVERFTQVNDVLVAVLSNGQVISSSLNTWAWTELLPSVQGANAAVALTI